MLERLDSRTLAEYMALEMLEPMGPVRGDIQAAIVASTIANCHRSKGSRPFGVRDFLPFSDDKVQSVPDMKTQLMQLVRLSGGEQ